MLDAYIIDELKKQQRERERKYEEGRRIWIDIPLPQHPRFDEEQRDRGEKEPEPEQPYKIIIYMARAYRA